MSKTITTLVFAVLFCGMAHAQAPTSCAPFDFDMEIEAVSFHDVGETGPSPSDVRTGLYRIFDPENQQIGELVFKSTVLFLREGNQPEMLLEGAAKFANGEILFKGIYSHHAPADKVGTADDEFEVAVIGGTGIFSGATGTQKSARAGEGKRKVSYTIACP